MKFGHAVDILTHLHEKTKDTPPPHVHGRGVSSYTCYT